MILERENNSNSKINKKYDAAMLLNNIDSRAAIKIRHIGFGLFCLAA
jgi:hypothetical protein